MKRAILFGLLVLFAVPASASAVPIELDANVENGAAMTRGSLYWIAPGNCKFTDECQKIKRTDPVTGKSSTAKQTNAMVTGIHAAGDILAYSQWDQNRGTSAIYVRAGSGKFIPAIKLRSHKKGCADLDIIEAISPEGAIAWTRFLNRDCLGGNYRFLKTTWVRWPGEPARRLGKTESVRDDDLDVALDPVLHPNAVSISGRRVLRWTWPSAVLYDFSSGAKTKLISDASSYDWLSPVALGPNGEVVVTRVVSRKDHIEAPLLRPDPANLSKSVSMRQPHGLGTSFSFCGNRIVTFNPYEGSGYFSVRDLAGTIVSNQDLNIDGGTMLLATILCDDRTLVAYVDDVNSEAGHRVFAIPLP
jgi:hypothetical protein